MKELHFPNCFLGKMRPGNLSIQAIQNTADFFLHKLQYLKAAAFFQHFITVKFREVMLKLSETLTFKLQREIYYSVF